MSYIVIHDYDFIEGLTAAVLLPIFTFLLKDIAIKNAFFHTILVISLSWIFTWFGRRIFVNMYKHYKQKYNWNGVNLSF